MSDLEKTIIDLKYSIDELTEKKYDIYDKKQELLLRKGNAEKKAERYSKKVSKLEAQLNDMLIKKLSLIISPIVGFVIFAILLFSGATPILTAFITFLGFVTGCGISNTIVNCNILNEKDYLLMGRIFSSIKDKQLELLKNRHYVEHFNSIVNELSSEESSVSADYDVIVSDLANLQSRYNSLIDFYFKKKEKELLPYYRNLEDVIKNTIKNPDQFYRNICNGLNRKEKKDIIDDIEVKNCQNCTSTSCKLTNEQKENIITCDSWYNEVEIGKSKVLGI